MKKPASGGLVYSTEGGRMCPACRRPVADCVCGKPALPAGDGIVRVGRESRRGKVVTLARGLPLEAGALAALGKTLRSACGAGGTVKEGVIELQGDHRDRVCEWLTQQGWKVKREGA